MRVGSLYLPQLPLWSVKARYSNVRGAKAPRFFSNNFYHYFFLTFIMSQIFSGTGTIANVIMVASPSGSTIYAGRPFVPNIGINITGLYVVTQAPGSGETTTVTMFVNGVATLLTATVSGDNLSSADFTHEIAVDAGKSVDFRMTKSGGSVSTTVTIQAAIE